jgi:hypothetical protein
MIKVLDHINNAHLLEYSSFENLSKEDIIKLSYSVFSRFNINYLSMSNLYQFENKFYDWVLTYIVGKKLPTSINMIRGDILEKYLLNEIKSFDDVEKLKEVAVIDFEKRLEENKENIKPYDESELESAKDFIRNTLHLNYNFFRDDKRQFFNQGLSVKSSIKGSINIYGIVDSLVLLNTGKEKSDGNKDGDKIIGCVELKSTERIPKEPIENHLRQLAFYLYCTGIDIGYLYYVGSSKYMKKGSIYMRIFAFKREDLVNYIETYLENMIYKMTKFLMKFKNKNEIIDIVIPQYINFFFDKNYRDFYGEIFDFKLPNASYVSSTEFSV